MAIPKGFKELALLAAKERPPKPKTVEDVWDKFLFIVFMGGKRSEPEINFIINMLRPQKLLDLESVKKTDGEDWREAVEKLVSERIKRIKDEDAQIMLRDFQKELFRISASIKGGARFFVRNEISPAKLDQILDNKEKTWEFIEDLAKDEDVSNIKYTKIIIWLHSMGYAYDFCPPSYQTKAFVNEIYGYYQFYEDDKYFMKKAEEFSEEVKKSSKGITSRDISMAVFYYITLKNMLPPRTPEKKRFNAEAVLKFLKSKKLTLKALSEKLSSFEDREALMESFYKFVHELR